MIVQRAASSVSLSRFLKQASRKMRPAVHRAAVFSAIAATLVTGLPGTARAADNIWTAGSATDLLWDTNSNWSSTLAPISTDDVIFPLSIPNPGVLSNPNIINLTSGEVANSLRFLNSYTLSGGSLQLTSGQVRVAIPYAATINSQLTGSAGLNYAGSSQSGRGSLYLTNNTNNFTGGVTIGGGTLVINSNGALGDSTNNVTINGSATRGDGGGALLINGGTTGGITINRNVSVQGRGPANDGTALINIGTNTISGALATNVGGFNSSINSALGTLSLGDVSVAGTSGTNFASFGTSNSGSVGSIALNGVLTGTGSIEKTGNASTLILNASDSTGFAGTIRISQGSLRIGSGNSLGTNAGATTNSTLDLNGGTLEMRSNTAFNTGKTAYLRTNSTIFVDHAAGGTALNQVISSGAYTFDHSETLTLNGRDGYGLTFTTALVNTGTNGGYTIANNLNGLLSITGNFWNLNNAGSRTFSFTGNGNTLISGNILQGTNASASNEITKVGAGTLTISSTGGTIKGDLNINQGTVALASFNSINNTASSVTSGSRINIGATTTAGTLSIVGNNIAAAQLSSVRAINLAGTTGGATINANQTGTSGAIVLSSINSVTTSTSGAKTLTLGGANTLDNLISGAITDSTGSNGSFVNTLTKTDAGTWVLSGTNSYSGGTNLQGGTLKINANGATSTILHDTNGSLTFSANANGMAGGTFQFNGSSGVNTTETISAVAASAGAGTIKLVGVGGSSANLVFGSLGTIASGTGINFDTSAANSGTVTITGAAANTATTLLGAGHLYINGSDFADATAGVLNNTAPNYTAGGVIYNLATTSLATAKHNMMNNGAFTNGAASISSLKLAGNSTLTLTGALTINLGSATNPGAILATGGTSLITGTSVSTGGTGEMVVRVNGSTDQLTLAAPLTATASALTKNGAGLLILSGVNAQTGTTTINEGTVRLSGATTTRLAGNNAGLTIRQGGTFDLGGITPTLATGALSGSGTINNSAATAATLTVGGNNTAVNFAGVIQNTGSALSIVKAGNVASTLSGTNSSYTGSTTIGSTALLNITALANIGSNSSIGRGNASSNATNAGSLIFTGTTGGLNYIGNASVSTDRLFTFNGSTGGGAVINSNGTNNSAIVFSNTGNLLFGTTATGIAQSLTLGGTSTGDNVFNPVIADNGAAKTSVVKNGVGLWILGGSNTYTGATTLTQGTLQANDIFSNGGTTGISSGSALVLGGTTTGGVIQSSGQFTRTLTTVANSGPGTVSFNAGLSTGSVGFSASDSKLIVAIGGLATPTTLKWNDTATGGFMGGTSTGALTLSSTTSLAEVEVRNGIDLNGGNRTINVDDNTSTFTDMASITGVISNSTATVSNLTKSGAGFLQLLGANTYDGTTTVTAGNLIVNSLGNSSVGGGSSVGSATNAASAASAVLLGNATTTGGVLTYVGAGESSDRLIRLNTTTAGNTIVADGSGALILGNVRNDLVAGAKTLTLRGSNNLANTLNGGLTDNGGALSVTHDTGGTWIMDGSSGYTGTTTVSAGMLGIGADNAIGTGTLSISNATIFATNSDRTLNNTVSHANNAVAVFVGDYSITSAGTWTDASTTGSHTLTNNIASGKTLNINGPFNINTVSGARTLTINGAGDTIINGAMTSAVNSNGTATNAMGVTYSGTGSLTLGAAGTASNSGNLYNGDTTISSGTLKMGANNTLPSIYTYDGTEVSSSLGNVVNLTSSAGFAKLAVGQQVNLVSTTSSLAAGTTITSISSTGNITLSNAFGTDLTGGEILAFSRGNVVMNAASSTTATLDLAGTNQTINGLTINSAGSNIINNSSTSASTLTFGQFNQSVTIQPSTTSTGFAAITQTGGGAINVTKVGTGNAVIGTAGNSNVVLGYTGATTVTGGSLTTNVGNSTTSIDVGSAGTLKLAGGMNTSGSASTLTSVAVAGTAGAAFTGGTLSFKNGVGQSMDNLTSLTLGSGSGTSYLELDAGDSGTDTLTTSNAAATFNNVQFIINDVDIATTGGVYNLLVSSAGGLSGATYSLSLAGYTGSSLTVSDTLVQLNAGTLVTSDVYWNGGTTPATTSWSTIDGGGFTNFSSGSDGSGQQTSLPGKGQKVIFVADNVTGGALSTTLDAPFSINSLEFRNNTGSNTLASPVTIAPGTGGTLKITPSSSANGINIATGGPASVTISAPLTLGGNQTWTVTDAASQLTISGGVSGNASLTTDGAGTVLLSGASSYTGNTTVNSGTLKAGAAGALVNGSSYTVNSTGTLTTNGFSNSLATLSGSGTVNNTGTAASTVTLGSTNSNMTFGGTLTNGGTATLAITKLGTGTLTLNGTNSQTGTTTVGTANGANAGSIVMGGGTAGTISGNAGLTIFGGTVDIMDATGQSFSAITLGGGNSSSSATLNSLNAIDLRGNVTFNASNNALGASINNGLNSTGNRTITVGNSTNAPTDLTIGGSLNNTSTAAITWTLTGAGNTLISGPTINGVGTGTSALVVTSNGTTTLSGTNTHTGGTTLGAAGAVNFGLLRLADGADNTLSGNGALTVFGGTVELGSTTANQVFGAVSLGGGATASDAPQILMTGGTGLLDLRGTLTYNATNNAPGGLIKPRITSTANRVFAIGDSNVAPIDLTLDGGMQFSTAGTITFTGAGNTLINGGIAEATGSALNIVKTNTGTMTISGGNSITGNVQLGTSNAAAAGTLFLTAGGANPLTNAGTITVFGGTIAMNDNSATTSGINVGAGAAGTTAQITGTGSIDLRGNITYNNTNNALGATIAPNLNINLASRTITTNDSTAAATDLTLTGNITNIDTAARTLTLASTGNTLISGNITNGAGTATLALTKTGVGTVTLNGSNSQTGTTTIGTANGAQAGSIVINGGLSSTVSGNAGLSIFGGTLAMGSSTAQQFSSIAMGGGNSTSASAITGTGAIDLRGTLTYNATNNNLGGTINPLLAIAATRTINVGDSTNAATDLTLAGGLSAVGAAATASFTGAGTTTVSAALSELSGGVLSVNKAGAGVLNINAASNYTGTTTISAGTLNLNAAHTGGGQYNVNGGTLNVVSSATLGSGNNFVVNNTGTAVVNGSLTTVGAGAVNVNSGGLLKGTGSITAAGGLNIAAGGTFAPGTSPGTITVSGPVTYNGGTHSHELDNDLSDLLVINNPSGNLTINAGSTLAVSATGTQTQARYDVINYAGTRTGTFDNQTGMPSNYRVAYDTGTYGVDAKAGAAAGKVQLIQIANGSVTGLTAVPTVTTMIVGGSTNVAVNMNVANNNVAGGDTILASTINSGDSQLSVVPYTDNTSIASGGGSHAVATNLTFTGANIGVNNTAITGSYTAYDTNSNITSGQGLQSTNISIDVLGHAAPTASLVSQSDANVIVGYAGSTTASVNIANGAGHLSNLQVNATPIISGSASLTDPGAQMIAPGNSGTAANATLSGFGAVGVQTNTVTYTAGDDQSIVGASALAPVNVNINTNVLDHAAGSAAVTAGNNQTVIVGYAGNLNATVNLANAAGFRSDLQVDANPTVTNGTLNPLTAQMIAAGTSVDYTATFSGFGAVGVQNDTASFNAGDNQAILGASALAPINTNITTNVLDHASGSAAVTAGDNQTVIVGATGLNATVNVANAAGFRAGLQVDANPTLTTGTLNPLTAQLVAAGNSVNYTATFDANAVGAGQTNTASFVAGDDQSLLGASALGNLNANITYNVLDHASGSAAVTAGNNQTVITGANLNATVNVANAAGYRADLQVDANPTLTTGGLTPTAAQMIAAGTGVDYTASFTAGAAGLGQTNTASFTAGDDQSKLGASALAPINANITYNVLDHASGSAAVTAGDNQTVIVGATGLNATVNVANAAGLRADLQVSANPTLTTGTLNPLTQQMISAGNSVNYTATFDANAVGAGQTNTASFVAGDDQSLLGASALAPINANITYNVLDHAAGSAAVTAGNNQTVIVGYAGNLNATVNLANAAGFRSDLQVDANPTVTNGTLNPLTAQMIAAGNSVDYTATISGFGAVGVQNDTASFNAGDNQSILGASALAPINANITTNVLDHASGSAAVTAGDNQTVIVGATGLNATVNVANAAGFRAGLQVDANPTLTTGTLNPLTAQLVAAGNSVNYTATFDANAVGAGQTNTASFVAGDDQSLLGASALGNLNANITYNVLDHASGSAAVTAGDNQTVITGANLNATVNVANAAGFRADLQVDANPTLTTGGLTPTAAQMIAAGTGVDYTASFTAGAAGLGQTNTASFTAGDDQSKLGASALGNLNANITYNVLDHASGSAAVTAGDNQTVIVGATGLNATVNVANAAGLRADLQVSANPTLTTGTLNPLTQQMIAAGNSVNYTATFDANAVGAGQTNTASFVAGDDQSLLGASALAPINANITYNVLDHAAGSAAVTAGNNQTVIVGYAGNLNATVNLANAAGFRSDLQVDANPTITTGSLTPSAAQLIAAGSSVDYTATISGFNSLGTIINTATFNAGDNQALAGASALAPITAQITTNVMDHASGSAAVTAGDNQTVIVGANLNSTVNVANAAGFRADLQVNANPTLTTGALNPLTQQMIAAGTSVNYTAAFTAASVGAGQVNTATFTAGDDQAALGASALAPINANINYNVLDHASGSASVTSGNNQNVIVGYAGSLNANIDVSNAAGYRAAMEIAANPTVTNGTLNPLTAQLVAAGGSQSYTATIGGFGAVGVQNDTATFAVADDSSLLGAIALGNVNANITTNVLDHASGSAAVTAGNNQTVIVGATGLNATVNVANAAGFRAAMEVAANPTLTTGGLTPAAAQLIAAGNSVDYTATFNAGAVGAGQTNTATFAVADDSSILGAVALGNINANITYNVLDHASGSAAVTSGNNQTVIVGYAGSLNANIDVSNAAGFRAAMEIAANPTVTNGTLSPLTAQLVAAGGTQSYNATIGGFGAVGVQNDTATFAVADDSSLLGAIALGNVTANITTNVVDHALGSASVTAGDNQTVIVGANLNSTVNVANAAGSRADLQVNANPTLTTGTLNPLTQQMIAAGNSVNYNAAFTAASVGAGQVNTATFTAGDDQAALGASALAPINANINYNVLDHASGSASVTAGDNQTVIVGATGLNATVNLANAAGYRAAMEVAANPSLTTGSLNPTAAQLIAAGNSVNYTATFNANSVGAGQTNTATFATADDSSILGATALGNVNANITYNVLDHAAGSAAVTAGNNQNVIVGYAGNINATVNVANAAGYRADLQVDANPTVTNGTLNPLTQQMIAAGGSINYTATLSGFGVVGVQNDTASFNAGDDQSLAGASALSALNANITTNVLDHASGSANVTLGNNQTVITGANINATVNVANAAGFRAGLQVDANPTLTTGSLTPSAAQLIAAGNSVDYTASFTTGAIGLGQTNTASFNAGDDQSLLGASALSNLAANITYNVLDHAAPTASVTAGNAFTAIIGANMNATVNIANAAGLRSDLQVQAGPSIQFGSISNPGQQFITAGSDANYGANFTLATIGAYSNLVTFTAGDDQSLAGANPLGPVSTTISGQVLDHSNASFVSGVDTNSQTINLGSIALGAGGGQISSFFDVFAEISPFGAANTANLELDSFNESDAGNKYNLLGFILGELLSAGSAHFNYQITLDTTSVGAYSATYTIFSSDENLAGATNGQNLILTIMANIFDPNANPEIPAPAAGIVGLMGFALMGLLRRRRNEQE